MAATLTDYFQVGPAVQQQLRVADIGLSDVGELASLADALSGGGSESDIAQRIGQIAPRAPAAFVGFDGEPLMIDTDGGGQILAQRWLVVLVVRNASDTARNGALRRDAGPLLLNVISVLGGWRPDIQYVGNLTRAPAPRPFIGPGVGLFPLAFTVPLYLQGGNL